MHDSEKYALGTAEERKEYYGAGAGHKVMYKGRCYRLRRSINGRNGRFCELMFMNFEGLFTVNPEKEAVIPGPVFGRKTPRGEEWDEMAAMWLARNRGEISNLEFQKMGYPNYPLLVEFHPNFLPKPPVDLQKNEPKQKIKRDGIKIVESANGEKHISVHMRKCFCEKCRKIKSGAFFRFMKSTPWRYCNECLKKKA